MAEAADFTEAVVEKADNHESGVWPIASCRYRLRLGNGWYALVNESIVNGQRALVYAHIPYRARWDFFYVIRISLGIKKTTCIKMIAS